MITCILCIALFFSSTTSDVFALRPAATRAKWQDTSGSFAGHKLPDDIIDFGENAVAKHNLTRYIVGITIYLVLICLLAYSNFLIENHIIKQNNNSLWLLVTKRELPLSEPLWPFMDEIKDLFRDKPFNVNAHLIFNFCNKDRFFLNPYIRLIKDDNFIFQCVRIFFATLLGYFTFKKANFERYIPKKQRLYRIIAKLYLPAALFIIPGLILQAVDFYRFHSAFDYLWGASLGDIFIDSGLFLLYANLTFWVEFFLYEKTNGKISKQAVISVLMLAGTVIAMFATFQFWWPPFSGVVEVLYNHWHHFFLFRYSVYASLIFTVTATLLYATKKYKTHNRSVHPNKQKESFEIVEAGLRGSKKVLSQLIEALNEKCRRSEKSCSYDHYSSRPYSMNVGTHANTTKGFLSAA